MSLPRHRLVTLVFSHYNEKARWALDVCGVDYEERAYMPGFSQLGVMAATRGKGGKADAVSSRFSTPLLVCSDGTILADSTDIARWASARAARGDRDPLFPDPSVLPLVESLGRELGPYTRLAAYWHALRDRSMLPRIADENVGRAQALAFRALAPFGSALIRHGLGVTEARYRRAIDKVRAQVEAAERRLDHTLYLAGDEFTAADLTFASLMAPVLLVTRDEGYSAVMPRVDSLEADARELVREMRESRGGRFALEMFRRHRRHAPHGAGAAVRDPARST